MLANAKQWPTLIFFYIYHTQYEKFSFMSPLLFGIFGKGEHQAVSVLAVANTAKKAISRRVWPFAFDAINHDDDYEK
jgi:hypothetical protein